MRQGEFTGGTGVTFDQIEVLRDLMHKAITTRAETATEPPSNHN